MNESYRRTGCSFLGVRMQQNMIALHAWERVLTNLPFSRILEIGTGTGGFSLFLYLHCMARGADFLTYDNGNRHVGNRLFDTMVKDYFVGKDIFEDKEKVTEWIGQKGRTIVFCDGGDKPREFNLFSAYLDPGDVIAAHDWNLEISMAHISSAVTNGNLKSIEQQLWAEAITAFFVKDPL